MINSIHFPHETFYRFTSEADARTCVPTPFYLFTVLPLKFHPSVRIAPRLIVVPITTAEAARYSPIGSHDKSPKQTHNLTLFTILPFYLFKNPAQTARPFSTDT